MPLNGYFRIMFITLITAYKYIPIGIFICTLYIFMIEMSIYTYFSNTKYPIKYIVICGIMIQLAVQILV